MNAMQLINALGYIDDDLVFDAIDGGEAPQPVAGAGKVKAPKAPRSPRGGSKTKAIVIGVVAVVLAVAITFTVLFLTGVLSFKQTPIYQGMYISTVDTDNTADSSASAVRYKGDYYGKGNDIDKDNPYDGGSIEQEVENTLQVTGAGQSMYYANVNEDIYITIKFSNPDYFDIISFVLSDGTTDTPYTSYMFESGSDYENIIIKLNVGNTAGITDYTISQIKYISGTIIKNVTIDGDTVVSCGVRTTSGNMVSAAVTNEVVTLDTISFTVNITDAYSLIAYSSGDIMAVLYDGENIVQTQNLEVGSNDVVFTNLTPDTLYQYAIVAYYDDLSGTGAMVNYLYTNAVYTSAIVLFDGITIGQEGISFSYVWYDGYANSAITSLTLTGGGETKTLTASDTSVTGLLSDTEYTLTATYVGLNGKTASITLVFTTEAKAVPAVEITTLTSGQESIDYAVSITDTDGVGALTSVTLSLNGTTVQTLKTATGTFTGLLSDNTYTVTVVYTYDLNDGTGAHTVQDTKEITTLAKTAPAVAIAVKDYTVDSLTFTVTYTDVDNIGSISSIVLYNGTTQVQSAADLTLTEYAFTGLSSNTEYTLVVTYGYNLNDGTGDLTKTQSLAEYTVPSVTANSIIVANTSEIISEGDSIVLNISMNNPYGVTFTSAVINGETYTASSLSNKTSLRIGIVYDDQLIGGDTVFTITQVSCKIDGRTYTIDISENNTVTAFINVDLNVEGFALMRLNGSEYEETNYGFPDEQLYYAISLNNASKYEVTGITIGGTEYTSGITMSSDYQTAYIAVNANNVNTNLTSISYPVNNNTRTKSLNYTCYYIQLTSSEIVEITTADQLLDVDDNKYYKLMNDIDLSGYEWVNMNNNMYGVFDGNGHTISGMGAVTSYSDTDLYLGLFKNVKGVITDLNVVNALYMVKLDDTTGDSYSVYAAGIGTISGDVFVSQVNVDISVEITITGSSNAIYVGGLLAYINYANCIIEDADVTVVASINAVNNGNNGSFNVGGLYGYYGAYGSYINSVNNVNVDLKTYFNGAANNTNIGAIAGYVYASRDISISNAVLNSQAEINYTTYMFNLGGVIGSLYGDANLYNVTSSLIAELTTGSNAWTNYDTYIGNINNNTVTIDDYCDATATVTENSTTYYIEKFYQFSYINGVYTLEKYSGTETDITLPETCNGSVYVIGSSAFEDCTTLQNVIIPEGRTTINEGAFSGCKSLVSITIPSTVTTIDRRAFEGCTALVSIVIPEGVTSISDYLFSGCTSLERVTIPDSVISIGTYAFQNCTTLQNIIIPEGITTINEGAFSGCTSLVSITIPSTVTTINGRAFEGCTALVSIVIPEGVTSIDEYLFNGCTSLKSVTIPDSVTLIGGDAFTNCSSLTSIVIGSGVEYISSSAFEGCSSLTTVYYNGTAAEWESISIEESGNDYLTSATIYYYSESQPAESGNYWHYVNGVATAW